MSKKTTGFRPEIWGLVFGLLLFTVLGGCKKDLPEWGPMKHAPPAPGKTWKPTPDSEPKAFRESNAPEEAPTE